MEFDYSKLREKIKKIYGTEQAFAAALGIGRVSLSKKLNNESDFTRIQMFKAAELLGFKRGEISDYFFKEKVQKNELGAAV